MKVKMKKSRFNTLLIALKSKEYGPRDYLKFFQGGSFSTKIMWDEILKINFLEHAPRLEVPVYFFDGRHDYNTPWELVQEYYQALDAPKGKHLVWFENSAHSPNLEEPEKFVDEMLRVIEETYP